MVFTGAIKGEKIAILINHADYALILASR